ncbi:hypothetical protein ACSSS7_004937 [Eimeria intestinalis]
MLVEYVLQVQQQAAAATGCSSSSSSIPSSSNSKTGCAAQEAAVFLGGPPLFFGGAPRRTTRTLDLNQQGSVFGVTQTPGCLALPVETGGEKALQFFVRCIWVLY